MIYRIINGFRSLVTSRINDLNVVISSKEFKDVDYNNIMAEISRLKSLSNLLTHVAQKGPYAHN